MYRTIKLTRIRRNITSFILQGNATPFLYNGKKYITWSVPYLIAILYYAIETLSSNESVL